MELLVRSSEIFFTIARRFAKMFKALKFEVICNRFFDRKRRSQLVALKAFCTLLGGQGGLLLAF